MLDIVGLPVMRQWFIVQLARRRLLPAAAALRQFLIDEGEKFLPPMPRAPARNCRARGASGPRRSKRTGVSMQIEVLDFVAGARAARGVAVVIDVFRAFSVACYAYARGAQRMHPDGRDRRGARR